MFGFEINKNDWSPVNAMGRPLYSLNNPHLKQMILNHLLQNFGIRMNCTNKYFRTFDNTTNVDQETLTKYKHKVYVNTNQPANLIILARLTERQPICLFIDKLKTEIYKLNLQFSNSLYDGTIFEGEVVDDYFLVSDFLTYKNDDLATIMLDKKLNLVKSIINHNHYHPDNILDPFKIIVKDFVDYNQLNSFISDYIPQLPYRNRISGVIFRPTNHSNKNLILNFSKDKPMPNKKLLKNDTINGSDHQIKHQISINQPTSNNQSTIKQPTPTNQQPTTNQPTINNQPTPTNQQPNINPSKILIKPQLSLKSQTSNINAINYNDFKIDTKKYKQVKFLLFETGQPDDYLLKLKLPNGSLIEQGSALVNDMKTSQLFQKLLKDMSINDKKNGLCVLCNYNTYFNKWKLIKLLIDEKPHCVNELI